jgi:hypothetical protein
MVWEAVNTPPVDWGRPVITNDVSCVSQYHQLIVVFSTNHLVTTCTESYWRNAGVCLSGDSAVTESTVLSKTFHGLAIRSNMIKLLKRRVNRVREIDWLIESLFESKHRNRLAQPTGNDKCCNYTHHGNYTETTNSQYRHEHLG